MNLSQRKSFLGFLFCLPLALGVLIVYGLPFCVTLFRSLQQVNQASIIGVANYVSLASNSAFLLALRNTLLFWVLALPCNVLLGLALASLCNRCFLRHCKPFLVFPAMVPAACSIALLQVCFSADTYTAILTSEIASPILIILLFLWKYLGYTVLILCAALCTIPAECIEAAAQCGANKWQIFWYIELPLLQPALAASFFFAFLNSFKIFREVYLLGGAYPNNSLYSLQHFLTNNFSNMNFARLAAASIVVIAFVCTVCGIALWQILQLERGAR